MLRLTLRAREDGRFLARIIERDGFAFVLDYGDPQMVADVSERIARGFSLYRSGKLETVSPSSPDLLPLLAEFYSQEGLVVALEEPDIAERGEAAPRLTGPVTQTATDMAEQTELRDLAEATELREAAEVARELAEEPTELVSMSDIPDVGEHLQTWIAPVPKKTNPGALQARTMWIPEEGPAHALEFVVAASEDDDEDEEETELVSPEMRARAMALEEGRTELGLSTLDEELGAVIEEEGEASE